ncbi:sensor histidine kinase [Hymenobacter convexus]|uniref:sensor histidine kinase n=1 Tax=Hymenobacter sp. CA1UV-4 TaxID=3063782 RepID=UPI00271418CD|nr:two-component regulator propeller domain-containing protein [Hymenobacter sp. CA1UV-4]MDO7850260.1 two-component regulator propeller domain-containing protein [Hymenobacter sp. CA1UV-4]
MFSVFWGLLPLALLSLCPAARAQSWQRDAVLSQVLVKQLARDSAGFMWVGTDEGLLRYDGYELVPLRQLRPTGPDTIPPGPVQGLLADATGTIWVGGPAGLFRYVPATGRLTRVPLPDVPQGRAEVYDLWQLPRTGHLWVSYGHSQLRGFDRNGRPQPGRWQLPRPVRWLAPEAHGPGLWVLTDGGRIFRLAEGRVTAGPTWPGRFLLPVPDTHPQQFVSTQALYEQATPCGPLRERQRWQRTGPEEGFQPLQLPNGTWELVNRGRLITLRWPAAGGSPAVAVGPAPQDGSSDTPLKYTMQATFDSLRWMYSRGQRGCYKRLPMPRFITPLAGPAGEVYSTRSIVRLPDGRLLASSYSPLLTQPAGQPAAPLRPLPLGSAKVPRILYGLLVAGPRVFFAEENHGFGELNPATGALTPFAYVQPPPTAIGAQVLLRDRRGQLWGGAHPGLFVLDPARRQARPYATGPAAAELARRDIRGLGEDPQGRLWLATDQGLCCLTPATGQLRRYGPGQPAPYRLPSANILCLYITPDGRVWAGTRDQGLLLVDPAAGVVQHYTTGTGLLSPTVVSVLPGRAGEVWAGTYAGLARVQPARRRTSVYTTADGLRNAELNRQAAWRDSDGTLYFGGVGGLHRVEPARAPADPPAPRLLLTGTTRYLNAGPQGSTDYRPAPARDSVLTLPAHTQFAAYHLALSDYLNPEGARFRYQLLDAAGRVQWRTTTPRTLLLPVPQPGRYTLLVEGENSRGVRTANVLRLPLLVQAVWWRHPAAWVLAAALLAGGAYWLHRRRLARALREAQLRTGIAADLHDEVGTLLTRVSVQAELLRGLPADMQEKALDNLLRNSRAAASTMRDVVWGIDARADSAGSLFDRMREYLDHTAAAAGWQTELITTGWPDTTPLPPAVRQSVYRVFKEAVTNAVRHAHGATLLRVQMSRRANQLVLSIADDGQPQAPRPASTGMGLLNMAQRAALLGGHVVAGPQPNGGFEVRLEAPLPA